MIYGSGWRIPRQQTKRKIFISYHHGGDQTYYDGFSSVFGGIYDVIYDNSLERKVDSEDTTYVMRRIREHYVTGSSCTVVLVGRDTWGRKYVDWEILATLEKQHGLIGMLLPTAPVNASNKATVPERLYDNIASGYALWVTWNMLMQNPQTLPKMVEDANGRPKNLICNDCARRMRNA